MEVKKINRHKYQKHPKKFDDFWAIYTKKKSEKLTAINFIAS